MSGDTPLFSAVYRASTDTILGTMQNYVVEFNATSGALMRAVKAISPMFGPMWINLIDGIPYISCRFPPADAGDSGTDIMWGSPLKDIFPLHPDTLEKNGTGLIWDHGGFYMGNSVENQMGPTQFFSSGNHIIFLNVARWYVTVNRMAVDNHLNATLNLGVGNNFWSEQACTDGTHVYVAEPHSNAIVRYNMTLSDYGDWGNTFPEPYDDLTSHWPIACEFVAGTVNKVHALEASKWLLRIDAF